MREAIPSIFFADAGVTVLADGWATCSDDSPLELWMNWAGPDWGDIVFEWAELALLLNHDVPSDVEKAPDLASARSKPAKKVSRAKLTAWYKKRVAKWSQNVRHPSEKQDWEDAKKQGFPEVTRDAVRELRSAYAPAHWTAKGRRKNPRV